MTVGMSLPRMWQPFWTRGCVSLNCEMNAILWWTDCTFRHLVVTRLALYPATKFFWLCFPSPRTLQHSIQTLWLNAYESLLLLLLSLLLCTTPNTPAQPEHRWQRCLDADKRPYCFLLHFFLYPWPVAQHQNRSPCLSRLSKWRLFSNWKQQRFGWNEENPARWMMGCRCDVANLWLRRLYKLIFALCVLFTCTVEHEIWLPVVT